MITNIIKNTKANQIRFAENNAVVVKETTDNSGMTKVTYVELGKINKQELLPIFKAAINSIICDDSIIEELKNCFKFVIDEDNTTTNKAFTPPTVKRLIANFSEDYMLGYSNSKGEFTPLLKVERQNLKSLLCLSTKKITEIWGKNSAGRRAEIHTLAKFAMQASMTTRETEFLERRKIFDSPEVAVETKAKAKTKTKTKVETKVA